VNTDGHYIFRKFVPKKRSAAPFRIIFHEKMPPEILVPFNRVTGDTSYRVEFNAPPNTYRLFRMQNRYTNVTRQFAEKPIHRLDDFRTEWFVDRYCYILN